MKYDIDEPKNITKGERNQSKDYTSCNSINTCMNRLMYVQNRQICGNRNYVSGCLGPEGLGKKWGVAST